jgi:hypothetical protein
MNLIKDMANMMMIQSNLMLKMYQNQTNAGAKCMASNDMQDLDSTVSSTHVELRNGKRKSKIDVIRAMRRIMITESLKVPWLSMLTPELMKLVDEK